MRMAARRAVCVRFDAPPLLCFRLRVSRCAEGAAGRASVNLAWRERIESIYLIF